jgi:hypothetical protein
MLIRRVSASGPVRAAWSSGALAAHDVGPMKPPPRSRHAPTRAGRQAIVRTIRAPS